MATATAMYHSHKNPLKRVDHDSEEVAIPKGLKIRRLHKAFLRYHDANNWPLLRDALRRMGREDLIGNGKKHLIPTYQPAGTGDRPEGKRSQGNFRTQHAREENKDFARNKSPAARSQRGKQAGAKARKVR